MPIRWKLSLWYSGVFLLIITLFSTSLFLFFTHRETNQFDAYLKEKAYEVHQSIKLVDQFPLPIQKLVLPDIDVFANPDIFLQIVNRQGRVISRSESLGEQALPISQEALRRILKKQDFFETNTVHGTPLRIYYLPLIAGNQLIGVLEVGGSLHGLYRSLANLRLLLIVGAILTATLSAIIGWFLARKALDPIERIIETTAAIEKEGNLEKRIDYSGTKDEIGLLSLHINSMLEKIQAMYKELEESYEAQRRFVADASHELRTPLTSIKGNIDFIKKVYAEKGIFSKDALDDAIDELERVTRIIHNLLALARADAGYKIPMEEISLPAWISGWLEEAKGLSTKEVQFVHDPLDKLEGVFIHGNPDLLKQIFFIILDNAFKYTSAGTVHLGFSRTSSHVKVFVEDTGIGIPEKEIPHIFDRFYRGENARSYSGTGLGLAIAKGLIEKHRGTIEISSEQNKGTKVTLLFPISLPSKP